MIKKLIAVFVTGFFIILLFACTTQQEKSEPGLAEIRDIKDDIANEESNFDEEIIGILDESNGIDLESLEDEIVEPQNENTEPIEIITPQNINADCKSSIEPVSIISKEPEAKSDISTPIVTEPVVLLPSTPEATPVPQPVSTPSPAQPPTLEPPPSPPPVIVEPPPARTICNICEADITGEVATHGTEYLLRNENFSYRVE